MTRRELCAVMLLAILARSIGAEEGDGHRRMRLHEPMMSYLDNGVIRLGVDLHLGGAVTYLAKSDTKENLVNSYDFGRQIQMSYYAGPVPFRVAGKEPKPAWDFIGWNPIQVGDAFGNAAKVLEHRNDGKRLYVKCVPMHWPLENVPGECTFECWLELEGAAVHARCRMVNDRPDHAQYAARHQELPALYTNGPWYRLMTCAGDKPFSGEPVVRIEKRKGEAGPWSNWRASESWAALVNDEGWGLGIWIDGVCDFKGGFAGKPGRGGSDENPTGYLAPAPREVIDWNMTHEYRYDLVVGSVDQIRKYVYDHAAKPTMATYRFEKDRQGWCYVHAADTGWPIRGELNVRMEENDPQIIGPVGCWSAAEAGTLVIEAACHSARRDSRIFWRNASENTFAEPRSMGFELTTDGEFHTYRVKLATQSTWAGNIAQLRWDPVGSGQTGEWIRVKSIRFEK